MPRLFPVSGMPGEIVVRPVRALRNVKGVFDRHIEAGQLVYARRSPFMRSAHSIWLETIEGELLGIVSPERFNKEFSRANAQGES